MEKNPITDLAQELDLARQNLHHAGAMRDAHFARAEAAEAEVIRLRAEVADYERNISWNVTCSNCAHLLDQCYAETCRAESAEAKCDVLRARLADVWAEGWYAGKDDTLRIQSYQLPTFSGVRRGSTPNPYRAAFDSEPAAHDEISDWPSGVGEPSEDEKDTDREANICHVPPIQCHASKDGECHWSRCPQVRDEEPVKSGRHCPLDDRENGGE